MDTLSASGGSGCLASVLYPCMFGYMLVHVSVIWSPVSRKQPQGQQISIRLDFRSSCSTFGTIAPGNRKELSVNPAMDFCCVRAERNARLQKGARRFLSQLHAEDNAA